METSKKLSLTVVIPAYNEIRAIRDTYENVRQALEESAIADYEILFATNSAPDGTHDSTPEVASQIAKENPHARHIHYARYAGLGFKYRNTVKIATKDYIIMIPGSNVIEKKSLIESFSNIGKAPLTIAYTINPEARPFIVKFVSKGFITLCNILFGLRLKYYNGTCMYLRKILNLVPMSADNPCYNAEIVIYLLKSGIKYIEIPQTIRKVSVGRTFNLKSVWDTSGTIISLFWNIYFKKIKIAIPKELNRFYAA